MKEITAISKGSSEEQYNIYIDNSFFISCNIETIKLLGLKTGSVVDELALQELVEESNIKKAFNKSLSYLSYRRRTEAELVKHLKDFDEATIEKALARLRGYSFVDDEAYGEDYVDTQANQRKGRYLIERGLIQKGIQQEIVENSLTRLTEEEELENAKKLSQEFFRSKRKLPYNQLKQKLSQKLLSKGYNWDIIKKSLLYLDENEEVQQEINQQQEEYLKQAIDMAEKLHSKYAKKTPNKYQLKAKIQGGLYQKGFEDDIIRSAIEGVLGND